MERVFSSLEDLCSAGYIWRITDNGGRTIDRYTVTFADGDYLALGSDPRGFSQWGDSISPLVQKEWVDDGDSVDLAVGDMSEILARHILHRVNEGMADFVEDVDADMREMTTSPKGRNAFEPKWVARSREEADINYGGYDAFGEGLYLKDGALMIRSDEEDRDLGPFTTALEAARATLPFDYDFYSRDDLDVDANRTTPDPKVLAQICLLEAKVEAEEAKHSLDR